MDQNTLYEELDKQFALGGSKIVVFKDNSQANKNYCHLSVEDDDDHLYWAIIIGEQNSFVLLYAVNYCSEKNRKLVFETI